MILGDGLDKEVKEKKFPRAVSGISSITINIYPVNIYYIILKEKESSWTLCSAYFFNYKNIYMNHSTILVTALTE